MSTRDKNLTEDGVAMPAPTMSAGSGQIAGIGVGPQGEPGVDLAARRKKKKKESSASVSEVVQLAAESIDITTEDLRKWFGSGKTGGIGGGGWDRYNTKGERIGKCGDAEERGGEGEGKPKCLSKEKAAQLRAQGGKNAIANAVKRKKAQDPVTDRKGTGGTPRPVSNRIGEAAFHLTTKSLLQNIDRLDTGLADMLVKQLFGYNYSADEINGRKRITKRMTSWASPIKVAIGNTWKDAVAQVPGLKRPLFAEREASMKPLHEKNVPTNPDLWSRAKAEAKKRFDVYPSAYANGWAAKWYKEKGGGWKSDAKESNNTPADREWGTDSLTAIYTKDTPGQLKELLDELTTFSEAWQKITTCQQCKAKLSPRELKLGFRICDNCVKQNKGRVWGNDADDVEEALDREMSCESCGEKHVSEESEYQGRKVTLGKPFRTPDGPKKFSVYVRNDKGNVVKVNFGDPNMEIKRDDPGHRKNFRARHGCDNPGPRWKAKYWSCRFWSKKSVSDLT